MPNASMPNTAAIKRSVFSGLQMHSNLSPALLSYVTFSPTIGIAAKRILTLGANVDSFREPLERSIREVMAKSIRRNFDVGGRPPWEPHSNSTIEIRDNLKNPVNDLLIASGTLRDVATSPNIWKVTDTQAVVTDLPQKVWYGKLHQGGYNTRGSVKQIKNIGQYKPRSIKDLANSHSGEAASIPARPFLIIQPEDEDAITEIFIKWLKKEVLLAWPGVAL